MKPDALNREPVVSNTTPLITLGGVGLVDLLVSLYGEIWIPHVVYEEYQVGRSRYPASPDLDHLPFISIHPSVADPKLSETLDAGEAAAIALARSCQARLVLLDERRGRREAMRLGLPIAGSLAVLLAAKQQGLLPAIGPVLDDLVAQGRRISTPLRMQVLELAGETAR